MMNAALSIRLTRGYALRFDRFNGRLAPLGVGYRPLLAQLAVVLL